MASHKSFSVIIHGGAGRPKSIPVQPKENSVMREALDAAWRALCAGEPGERAVGAALQVLEANELFNAGFGSYPNIENLVRCDVALMRGNGDYISYLNTRRLKMPSAIALEDFTSGKTLMAVWTDAMMKRADSASSEAKQRYGWVATEAEMIAPRVANLEKKEIATSEKEDTVGCVVRDGEGRLFAGTTTGGTMKKPDGRIGDAPIIGAGVFADDEVCGLSASGHGEAILKSLISGYIIADIRSFLRADSTRFEKDPELLKKILISELNDMRRRHPGQDAGFIVIPKKGAPSYAFNSLAMPVAVRHGSAEKIEFEEVQFAQR